MIGRFLELGIVTPDPGEAWLRFQRLGFAPAETGDVWAHTYGVVVCEGLAIGFHGAGEESPVLYFVKQDVAALERALEMFRVPVEHAQLGSDVFNELTLREPGGMAIRVIEARTFSPPAEVPGRTGLGTFRALSLPCPDLAEAREFWELMGMELRESAGQWEGFSVAGTPLTCHSRGAFKQLAVLFEGGDEAARDAWRQAGLGVALVIPR